MASESRLGTVAAELVKVAPITEVGLVALAGVGALFGGLPEARLERVIGTPERFWHAGEPPTAEMGDYVGIDSLLARLLASVLGSERVLLVTVLVLLGVGLSFLWLRACKEHPLRRESAGWIALTLAALLLVGVGSVALHYPKYAAPGDLRAIAVGLSPPESFWGEEGWPAEARRAHYRDLYTWFHGALQDSVQGEVRAVPQTTDLDRIDEFFDELAAYTIWSLLVLLGLSFLASACLPRLDAGVRWKGFALSAVLVLALVVNIFQWCSLVASYGSLPGAAEYIRERLAPYSHEMADPYTSWPFLGPQVERVEAGRLLVRNLWPVTRPEASLRLRAQIQPSPAGEEKPPEIALARNLLSPSPDGEGAYDLVLSKTALNQLLEGLAAGSEAQGAPRIAQIWIFDGFGWSEPAPGDQLNPSMPYTAGDNPQ